MNAHWIGQIERRTVHSAQLFEGASALAGMGAWECDLETEALTWTSGVFALFGIDDQTRLDRRETVAFYCEDSRLEMEMLRAHAIARRQRFSLDAQIIRPDGARRWMRLTGDVACRNGRPTHLYGLKQDITEERLRADAIRRLAEHDALTGVLNRSAFQERFLDASASIQPPAGALVRVQIDGLGQVNASRGHEAGDECLKAVVRRLSIDFPDAQMIARIGGDELALVMRAPVPRILLERRVARVLARISAPVAWRGQWLDITASAGIALANPLAYDAQALFAGADEALYAAKSAG